MQHLRHLLEQLPRKTVSRSEKKSIYNIFKYGYFSYKKKNIRNRRLYSPPKAALLQMRVLYVITFGLLKTPTYSHSNAWKSKKEF